MEIDAAENSATGTLIFRGISFSPGIFRVTVTIQSVPPMSEVLDDQGRIEFMFTDLDPDTAYSYNIIIQSTTDSTVVIGSSTGTFTTDGKLMYTCMVCIFFYERPPPSCLISRSPHIPPAFK